jgi:hypothetical protein
MNIKLFLATFTTSKSFQYEEPDFTRPLRVDPLPGIDNAKHFLSNIFDTQAWLIESDDSSSESGIIASRAVSSISSNNPVPTLLERQKAFSLCISLILEHKLFKQVIIIHYLFLIYFIF